MSVYIYLGILLESKRPAPGFIDQELGGQQFTGLIGAKQAVINILVGEATSTDKLVRTSVIAVTRSFASIAFYLNG